MSLSQPDPYGALSDYDRVHLPHHLVRCGDRSSLFALLSAEFGASLRAHTHSDALFMSHVATARAEALSPADPDFAAAVRMMFLEVGLTAAADAVSPWAPVLAARLGDVDRALDLAEVLRVGSVRAAALVLILRTLGDRVEPAAARRAARMAAPLADSEHAVAVLVAVADALRVTGDRSGALAMLATARRAIDGDERQGVINAGDVKDLALGLLRADEFSTATEVAVLEGHGIDTMSVRAAVARRARACGDVEAARRAVRAAGESPEWVNADYGLAAADLFDAAAEAETVGETAVADRLRKRAHANGRPDSVPEILASAGEAARQGDEAEVDRLLARARERAAAEWADSFRARAFASVARSAHELGRREARDEAIDGCLEHGLRGDLRDALTVVPVLELFRETGRSAAALPILQRFLDAHRPTGETEWWRVDDWAQLLVQVARLDVQDVRSSLSTARAELERLHMPRNAYAALGMACADAGLLDEARSIQAALEAARAERSVDPVKSLVLTACSAEARRLGATSEAEAWLVEASSLLGADDDQESLGQPVWLARQVLEWHEQRGAEATGVEELLPPPPEGRDPEAALAQAREREAAMGGGIGNVGAGPAMTVAEAVGGYLAAGRVRDAVVACRELTYWRLLTYTQTSPMDAEERGTFEALVETSVIHAGCIVAVARRAGPGEVDFTDLLAETTRIPYRSIGYAARAGIGGVLADPSVAVTFVQSLLGEGRDEVLSAVAALLPSLAAPAGLDFVRSVHDGLDLVGRPWLPAQAPPLREGRSVGGLFRTFDIVGSAPGA